jgi:ubiquinone biosynthesis protein
MAAEGTGGARPPAAARDSPHDVRFRPTPRSEPMSDLELGSFSDDPPWQVEPDAMSWRRIVPALRAATRLEVPRLTHPGRVPPGLRVVRVVRHLGLAVGVWAAGARRKGGAESRADISERLRKAAEALGPTYIKLAQIISSGEGIFPEELVSEFRKCRDQVPPEPFAEVRRVIEEDLRRPVEEVFSHLDPTPLAAASIAQVHRATLRTGEDVVVKVQRPAVATLVRQDLRVMAWIAPFMVGRIPISALANPPALVELFAETITEELDFRLEAQNMLDVARSFAELGQRRYVIPRPHPELVTRRVLVMERLDGFKFDDVAGMHGAGIDTEDIVRTGMIGFMEGALLHGIFHGDLHGGNLFVMPDGRTALLDFGITGRLDEHRRMAFLRMLMAGTMNDVRGPARRPAGPRGAAARHRPRRRHPGPGPRQAAGRPHHHVGRGAGGRDPAGDQGAARHRRPHAQGADALHQEHGVPRRRHRHDGPRPRRARRDRRHLDALRHHPRRAPGCGARRRRGRPGSSISRA